MSNLWSADQAKLAETKTGHPKKDCHAINVENEWTPQERLPCNQ
jgi:hypothetical protein